MMRVHEIAFLAEQGTKQRVRARVAGIARQNSFAQYARPRKIAAVLKRPRLFKIDRRCATGSRVMLRARASNHPSDERSQHVMRFLARSGWVPIDATGARNDNLTFYFTRRIIVVDARVEPRRLTRQCAAAPY